MTQKTYFLISGLIFLLVSLLHLSRSGMEWDVAIGGWTVPLWVSWAVVLVAGFLAFIGLRFSKK